METPRWTQVADADAAFHRWRIIELDIADHPRMELGHFPTHAAADQWRQRLQDEVRRG